MTLNVDVNHNKKMMLEPRLTEYLEKKNFYQANNILPNISLEKEYNITDTDLRKLNLLNKNIKTDNSNIKQYQHQDFVDSTNEVFPSALLLKDARLDKLKKKQSDDKNAFDNRFSDTKSTDFIKTAEISHNVIRQSNMDFMANSKDIAKHSMDNPNRLNIKNQHKSSKIPHYKTRLHTGLINVNNDNNIMNSFDNYEINDNKYFELANDNKEYSKKRSNSNNNLQAPIQNNNIQAPIQNTHIRDINIENYMKYGDAMQSQSKKSLGFPSAFEHGFQYISNDMQLPEHTVNDRGYPSRLMNKETIKKTHERDIM